MFQLDIQTKVLSDILVDGRRTVLYFHNLSDFSGRNRDRVANADNAKE